MKLSKPSVSSRLWLLGIVKKFQEFAEKDVEVEAIFNTIRLELV
jgi:hypothetical protein